MTEKPGTNYDASGDTGRSPDNFAQRSDNESDEKDRNVTQMVSPLTHALGLPKAQEKMNIFQTSLALVATNIGGGILAIPYAFY